MFITWQPLFRKWVTLKQCFIRRVLPGLCVRHVPGRCQVPYSHTGSLFKVLSWLGTTWWSHLSQFYFLRGQSDQRRQILHQPGILLRSQIQSLGAVLSMAKARCGLIYKHKSLQEPHPVPSGQQAVCSTNDGIPPLPPRSQNLPWMKTETKPRGGCWRDDTQKQNHGARGEAKQAVKTG